MSVRGWSDDPAKRPYGENYNPDPPPAPHLSKCIAADGCIGGSRSGRRFRAGLTPYVRVGAEVAS